MRLKSIKRASSHRPRNTNTANKNAVSDTQFPMFWLIFFLADSFISLFVKPFPPSFLFLLFTYPLRQYNNPQQCNQAFPHILADMFLLPRKRLNAATWKLSP